MLTFDYCFVCIGEESYAALEITSLLKELGAKNVYACCTHGVLSGPAFERINNSAIEELIMLNTIPLPETEGLEKFKSISVAPLFAEAIKRIYDDEPISKLFEN